MVCCDKHRPEATVEQVLGPIGYGAITYAFKKLRKKAPSMSELSVDFQSLDFSRLDGSEVESLIPPAPDPKLLPPAPKVIDIRDAENIKITGGVTDPVEE